MALQEISVVPVLQIAGAYTAADNVGGLLTFDVAGSGRPIVLKRLIIIDADKENAEFNIHFFNASPAAAARTDADAYAPVAADLAKKLTTINVAGTVYVDSASDSIAIKEDLDYEFVLKTELYAVLACVATPTYTAVDDLTVKIVVDVL